MENIKTTSPQKIAIFCSGSGSNAENIMQYFAQHPRIQVGLLVSNNPQAYALERAKKFHVPTALVQRQGLYESTQTLELLQSYQIEAIVLAGFLWLIPPSLIKAFPHRILNIHPSLLPQFGGKGMYGIHVHRAVIAAGETESGMTIHVIDDEYDKGQILLQARCPVLATDTPETLAQKVLELEHRYYPMVIENYLQAVWEQIACLSATT